ncbi:MAG TPA: hypothetical protein VKN14_05030 [Flavobacteriaceae bacterium]|nr:hypothetical protein [Flavobacteriaceae bacterium]
MKKIGMLFAVLAMVFTSCSDESLNMNTEPNQVDGASKPAKSFIKAANYVSDATVIDFEGFIAGDIVSVVNPEGCEGSITVMGVNPDFPGENAAMIFDSSNPTGDDFDLGTPNEAFAGPGISEEGPQPSNDTALGNVLIVSEDLDSSDPDDSAANGTSLEFDFSGYGTGAVTLHSLDLLDLEDPGDTNLPTVVTLYDGMDNVLLQKVLPYSHDNAKQLIDFEGTEGVVRLLLELNNSGAIDNLMLTCKDIEIGGCETMFAKGGDDVATCFIEDDFSRWGWTNGPLSSGEYSFDIYAGAGQCDTEKGTLVGSLTVNYDDVSGEAEVTYSMNDDFVIKETHLYIGNDPYPTKKQGDAPTVAPGQFPYQHGDLDNENEDTYNISGLSGDIYIIAHGVVCEIIR